MTLLFHVSVSINAQTVNFSGKNVSLKKIFSTIKKQTGTVFFYDEALIKEAKPVTVNLNNASLETALNEIFKDQPLTWALEDKTVTITKRPISITTPAEIFPQQSVQAKGNITDDYGIPVSDVSVTVRGKQQGTISDKDGRFSIKADPKDILVFSSVGYATKEVKVESRELNIELQLEIKPMESLIVGGNFSASKRKADATSVTVIDSKTLEKIPTNTIDQIFRGWVPGTNNFEQGSSPAGLLSLSIRGAGNPSSVAPVAVYIDGIEYAGGSAFLCQLDKTNIDRIEIVRGPGASTLYGTGSNGGIVQIFTKKGRANQTTVNFSSSAGFYKSKWVEKNAFQQLHNLELVTGFQKASLTMGATYRTVGAYFPDGGETHKGFYLDAKFDLGKLQVNAIARYNVSNYSFARDPIFDTAIHPRTDIIISPSPGVSVAAYEWFRVRPTVSDNKNGFTETYITGINLSHNTTKNWINKLDIGYTSNDYGEVPVANGITPLQRLYQTINHNITTVRYFNTLTLPNNGHDLKATILSGLEFKNYSPRSVSWTFANTNTFRDEEPDNKNYGAFVQINPSYKNVYLTMGLRYEKNELFKAALNPRIGLTTNFDTRSLTIKPRISWGKGITPPSYSNRFGEPANAFTIVYPNPDMKPQSQQGFDYGLELYDKKGKYKFEVVYYDNILEDMITQLILGPDTTNPNLAAFVWTNAAQVVNRGWEFSGAYTTKRFNLQGTFSIMNSTVEDTTGSHLLSQLSGKAPGTRMYNLPRHTAGLNFTYSFYKLFGKNDRGSVSLNVTEVDGVKYQDSRTHYLDIAYGRAPYNPPVLPYEMETPAVFRVGFFADYLVVPNLRFFAQGSNILNDYNYENSITYPAHGATWLFGLKYNFVKTNLSK
ncbi:MAG TPA: TonB-dependent receptor [Chitinophagaceae bacterium]